MTCTCCNGRRVVASIDGSPRPCSRCSAPEFNAWALDRRQKKAPPAEASGVEVTADRDTRPAAGEETV